MDYVKVSKELRRGKDSSGNMCARGLDLSAMDDRDVRWTYMKYAQICTQSKKDNSINRCEQKNSAIIPLVRTERAYGPQGKLGCQTNPERRFKAERSVEGRAADLETNILGGTRVTARFLPEESISS